MPVPRPPRRVDFEVAHLSNSPSAMTRPTWRLDMGAPVSRCVRLSLIPDRRQWACARHDAWRTVAMVSSRCRWRGSLVRPSGIAERDTNLALLPVGYADGVYCALAVSMR